MMSEAQQFGIFVQIFHDVRGSTIWNFHSEFSIISLDKEVIRARPRNNGEGF